MTTIGKLGWKNPLGEGIEFEVRTLYDAIDVIERKPAIFIGEASISALFWTINGFRLAVGAFDVAIGLEEPPFRGFHDFVANAYGYRSSSAGWRAMLLEQSHGDEHAAYDAFFTILRRYRATKR